MISYIEIKDFAIVKHLELELFPGLNVITGETGAGKSVIIEAVSMALGARADTDYVRRGADKAVITLVIDPEDCDVSGLLDEMGVPYELPLMIRREISAGGRSMCRVNGMPVPLSSLSKLCSKLADIHGQYDHQYLLDPDNHINILDLYGGEGLAKVKNMVSGFYSEYTKASGELMRLRKRLADAERQKDLYRYELNEIEAAGLKPGEDDELAARISLMQNSENIYKALSEAYECVYGDAPGALSALGSAMSQLESVNGYSDDLKELCERFSSAYYELEDMNGQLRSLREKTSFSIDDFDECIGRMETINALKRKYGKSIEAILEYADKARTSLSAIENADAEIAELERRISLSKQQYDTAAARLTVLRKDAASQLERNIDKELSELNFRNAQFRVDIQPGSAGESGLDKVEFLISANLGEDLKPLTKVASGGELSRIMLALKRIIGDLDGIPTMIFDEIDTGISGATAGVVGEKLRSIAENHQIVCITHLPQIAARGEHHYRIEKHSDEISTQTTVVPLSEDERVEEIARLLSGTTVSDAARLAAKELLAK